MSHAIKMVYLAAFTVLLPACALIGPEYQRPEDRLPGQYSVETNPEADESATVSARWWEMYQDPALNDLVQQALRNNQDIKLAAARVEEADAFSQEVGAALLPQIDLDAGASRSRISELGSSPLFNGAKPIRESYQIKLGTSFELDFWGKLRRAKESARAQALASRYARETVQLTLSGLVASNYLLLRSLDAQLIVSQDSLRTRDEALGLARRRLEGGVVSILDVHQAETARANMEAQIADLIRQRGIAQHLLAILTGVLDLQLATQDLRELPVPPVPPPGLPSSLLASRPDIARAEQDMIAANANIGVAKAALYPTITLTTSFGGESAELGDVLKSAARIWTGGLALNLPIFDSGRLDARVDQASAQQKQALATYESAIENAFREVNDALISVRQNAEREKALLVSESASRKAMDITVNRYDAGYSAYLEVLDAQRVHNEAAIAYIQSRQARLIASVDLFKALGGGWRVESLE